MTRLDDLPPDQHAVLSLLLRRGKDYAEIADMLGISESTVRERARAALDALEEGSGQARGSRPTSESRHASGSPQAPESRAASRGASPPPARRRSSPAGPSTPPGSRRAGALLLATIAVVAIVAIVLLTSGGGGHKSASTSTSTTGAGSTTTSAGTTPHVEKQLRLAPPESSSKALGVVQIVSQGSKRAFFIAAENLAPTSGFFYAAWLYNSEHEAEVLGRAPPVTSNGRLQAVALLPANASKYHTMLITKETSERPSHPGPIVLRGPFSL